MQKPKQYELAELLAEANRLREADSELAKTASFNPRTVHYYVQQGLLPGRSGRRGPGTFYSEQFLYRLLAIRRLQRETALTLADIREVMSGIKPETLKAVALGEERIKVQGVLPGEYSVSDLAEPDEETMLLREMRPPEAAMMVSSEQMLCSSDAPKGVKSPPPRSSLRRSKRSPTSEKQTPIKHTFPLGDNAELVLRKSITAKQMRQLGNIVKLLEDVLGEED